MDLCDFPERQLLLLEWDWSEDSEGLLDGDLLSGGGEAGIVFPFEWVFFVLVVTLGFLPSSDSEGEGERLPPDGDSCCFPFFFLLFLGFLFCSGWSESELETRRFLEDLPFVLLSFLAFLELLCSDWSSALGFEGTPEVPGVA